MRLSREKFHFRGICIRIFSFCTWFIHEREQSNQTRKSPKWKLHVCLKVLWLDLFPDILPLGSCTGVSDSHRSAPSDVGPSDVGHQSVAPVLLPHLEQNLCEWICTNPPVKGRGGTAVNHGQTSKHPVLWYDYGASLYTSYLDLNKMIHFRDSDWLSPKSFQRFFFFFIYFNVIFWDCSRRENDSCCDCKAKH